MGAKEDFGRALTRRRIAVTGWIARHERRLIVALIAAGVALRAAWCAVRKTVGASGEAMRVAEALGSGRGFADAYRIGQGPTAHLLPIPPGIAGIVYAMFGTRSILAEVVLFCWSVGMAMATLLILYRAFGRLTVSVPARLAGLAFGCMAPTYFAQEAVDFRVWDGGLATLLAASMLDRTIRAARAEQVTNRDALGIAGIGALLFFINPSVGIAYGACAAWIVGRRLPMADWWRPAGLGIALVALLVLPWAIRNDRVMKQPIPLRSNAGLELAIGLYPGELEARDRGGAFMSRLGAIHPSLGDAPYRRMVAAGGEVAYARTLGREASAWARAHPADAIALLALHVRQTLVPQAWQFGAFGSDRGTVLRAALAQATGVFGLAGLAWALLRRRTTWWCPATALFILVALGAPFQPVKRYTYLVYPTLIFAAASLLDGARRRDGSEPPIVGSAAA